MFSRFSFLSKQLGIHLSRSYSLVERSALSKVILETTQIQEAIKTVPTLSSVPLEVWRSSHYSFSNNGLKTQQFLDIITKNPEILLKNHGNITGCFESWHSCQFGEKHLHQLITKYPMVLDIKNERELLIRVTFLRGFVGTTKNVWRLFMNSPNLIDDNSIDIERKFDYLCDIMRIDVPEIVKSGALALNFQDLQARHVFLERLGLFKARSLKADPNLPTTNPRLFKITDTSPEEFATDICGVELIEFETFIELYNKELENITDEIDEHDGGNEADDINNDDNNVKINLL